VRDVIARDRMSVPIPLRLQSPIFLGDEDMPSTGTPHRGFARAEAERLWSRLWRLACRAHLRRPGSHHLGDVDDLSAVVVRDGEDLRDPRHCAVDHASVTTRGAF
jgi:hypothetical protein